MPLRTSFRVFLLRKTVLVSSLNVKRLPAWSGGISILTVCVSGSCTSGKLMNQFASSRLHVMGYTLKDVMSNRTWLLKLMVSMRVSKDCAYSCSDIVSYRFTDMPRSASFSVSINTTCAS